MQKSVKNTPCKIPFRGLISQTKTTLNVLHKKNKLNFNNKPKNSLVKQSQTNVKKIFVKKKVLFSCTQPENSSKPKKEVKEIEKKPKENGKA